VAERTVAVVGAGIVRLAVARELVRRGAHDRVVVLEQEDRVGAHQTGHNSGVVHAGIYYRPGSLKATLCTRGRELLGDYCAEHALPFQECGKVVVAVAESERARFEHLARTAEENGVPGLTRLGPAGLADVEPNAAGLMALHSPRTAITDFVAIAEQLADDVRRGGGSVRLSTRVGAIRRHADRIEVRVVDRTGPASLAVDELVLCGGLEADRLGALAGQSPAPRIVPFRGEYLAVSRAKQDLVRGMIYPVPDPRYPFLGVHFTRSVDGSLQVGPNAFLALSRSDYRRGGFDAADLAATVAWPGFWRFAARHWRTGLRELRGVVSVRSYLGAAQAYVPAIGPGDVTRSGLGLRAQAVDRDGSLVDDFRIVSEDGITSLRNAPSPAATSSLAIAEYVVDRLTARGRFGRR